MARAEAFAHTEEYKTRHYVSAFSDRFDGLLTGRFSYLAQTFLGNYRLLIDRNARCVGTSQVLPIC